MNGSAAPAADLRGLAAALLSTLYDLRDVRSVLGDSSAKEAAILMRTEGALRGKAQQLTGAAGSPKINNVPNILFTLCKLLHFGLQQGNNSAWEMVVGMHERRKAFRM